MEAWSPNHWTAKDFPEIQLFVVDDDDDHFLADYFKIIPSGIISVFLIAR